jgi:hypothetical protein
MSIHSTGLGADERLVVSPKTACLMLDVGVTRLYQLLDAGELESFLDGNRRRITVASIKARTERLLEQAKADPSLRESRNVRGLRGFRRAPGSAEAAPAG